MTTTIWGHTVNAGINDANETGIVGVEAANVPISVPLMLTPAVWVGQVDGDVTAVNVRVRRGGSDGPQIGPTMTTEVALLAELPNIIPCVPVFDSPGQPADSFYQLTIECVDAGGLTSPVYASLQVTYNEAGSAAIPT